MEESVPAPNPGPKRIMEELLAQIFGEMLAPPVVRFFARKAAHLLVAVLLCASFLLAGVVASYRAIRQDPGHSQAGLWVCALLLVLCLAVAAWYARRIWRGTWRQFWTPILKYFHVDP